VPGPPNGAEPAAFNGWARAVMSERTFVREGRLGICESYPPNDRLPP
jgi:hypothetical protein